MHIGISVVDHMIILFVAFLGNYCIVLLDDNLYAHQSFTERFLLFHSLTNLVPFDICDSVINNYEFYLDFMSFFSQLAYIECLPLCKLLNIGL